MSKNLLKFFLIPVSILLCFSVVHAKSEEETDQMSVYDKAIMHITFDEKKGKTALDNVTEKQLPISYVYNQAVYKQSIDPIRKKGVLGNSLSFDGFSTSVNDSTFVMPSDKLSISLWVAPRVYEAGIDNKITPFVLKQNSGKTAGFALGMERYGMLVFQVGTDQGWFEVRGGEIPKYEWTHVTAVFDGKKGKMRLYVNGTLRNERTLPANLTIVNTPEPLRIGKHNYPSQIEYVDVNCFAGLMDDLVVFAEAIGNNEVKQLRKAGGNNPSLDFKDVWLDAKILADDIHRPQYHIAPPQNWMNEAISPFYYNGKYHLFYQQTPNGPYISASHWGHWVSNDMVRWESLKPALAPENNGIDNDAVFSGNAILDDDGKPVIFYTGVNLSLPYLNRITLARPKNLFDPNLTDWNKLGSPIINQGSVGLMTEFRDPFIYKEDGFYYMLVGSGNATTGNPTVELYRTNNDSFEEWDYMGTMFTADKSLYPHLSYMWELPVFYKVYNEDKTVSKYLMMVAPLPRNGGVNDINYWLGDFNKVTGKFTPDSVQPTKLDYGNHVVAAPSGFYDPHSKKNLLFTFAQDQRWIQRPYMGYMNGTAMIRELSLDEDGDLLIKPYSEVNKLHDELLGAIQNATIAEANALLANIEGDMLHIKLELENQGATNLGISVRRSSDEREETRIDYRYTNQTLSIDTNKSSLSQDMKALTGGNLDLKGENLKLDIYVDRSLIEAFVNDRNSVTAKAYTTLPDSMGLKLYSTGGTGKVKKLQVYSMKSIYGQVVPPYYQ